MLVSPSQITIEKARSHNLKNVSCSIPLGQLTVVTGVSGSGKSSLAFDTLYAEGQRRYVVSLSTYARQFLERLPRPDVDSISHLPPAIAIEQHNRVTGARSTVGTSTEILDHLRLLFAKIGETECPDCRIPAQSGSVQSVSERILERWRGQRISLGTPLGARAGERAGALRERLVREGYRRVLDPKGKPVDISEEPLPVLVSLKRSGLLLIDRVRLADDDRTRLAEAVAAAFARGEGRVVVVPEQGERATFREGFACDRCGRAFAEPEPALFSFNSPRGACPECQGFGRVAALDVERVVPNAERTLRDDAIAPFATPAGRPMKRDLLRACKRLKIPTDAPFSSLTERQRELVFAGDGGEWYGVRGFFEWLDARRYKVQSRVLIARYRRFDPCPVCAGTRLRAEALCVRIGGKHVGDVSALTIAELRDWLAALELSVAQRDRSGRLLEGLRARVDTAHRVGLGYLGLNRQMRTLSGGEAQRIQLATALGGALTAALYVLDEPSVGLHPRDLARLLEVLHAIRDRGNTLVVVEHAPEVIAAADYLLDLGPGAGSLGGALVAAGTTDEIRSRSESLTGRLLRGELESPMRPRRAAKGKIAVEGARENNLRDLDVTFPLGQLVAVTGVSGAGKSTLVRSVLVGQLRGDPDRGACRRVVGRERVGEVVVVEPNPPSRSSRSNAATVSKAFEGIRKRFAATREARALGVSAGWFSFNVKGGRCEACEGAGEVVVDMQFLEDIRVPCERCQGTRYQSAARDVRVGGRSIVDVLAMTIDEASEFFADDRSVTPRLEPLRRVGLGYLTLGQPLLTLSGGEAQRLRLALALGETSRRSLYVLDEPTTGLHTIEVQALIACFDELLDAGGSVIVIEHNLDLICRADHVIDLGPEGGPGGGRIVAEGPPEVIAKASGSPTGEALRAVL